GASGSSANASSLAITSASFKFLSVIFLSSPPI
ncbi:MAG: hypothetical protein ACI822_001939, partial [Gammaproteobacteria bacterium]